MEKYHFVFVRDRVGRLADAQEFEHLEFPRRCFPDDLLEYLVRVAGATMRLEGDRVIVRHLYTERRVTPLNLFLKDANEAAAEDAVVDYGNAIKDLAATISRPPHNWTPERLWAAYEALEASRVRGSAGKQFTNLISLVRKALDPDRDLVAYPLTVDERFQSWLAQQQQAGTTFTVEQLIWLTSIKDHLATSLVIGPDDFELEPFVGHGGFGRANGAFAGQLGPLLDVLTRELVA